MEYKKLTVDMLPNMEDNTFGNKAFNASVDKEIKNIIESSDMLGLALPR